MAADTDTVWKILCQLGEEHDIPCKAADPADVENDSPCLSHEHAQEITRYGGAELHNISSLLGGVAAQVSAWYELKRINVF